MTETADPMAIITAFLEQVIVGLDEGTVDVLRETDSTRDNADVDYSLTYHGHKVDVYEREGISVDGTSLDREELDHKLRDRLMSSCSLRADILARGASVLRGEQERNKKAAERKARIAELAGKLRL